MGSVLSTLTKKIKADRGKRREADRVAKRENGEVDDEKREAGGLRL